MEKPRAIEVLENAIEYLQFQRAAVPMNRQNEWDSLQDAILILERVRRDVEE